MKDADTKATLKENLLFVCHLYSFSVSESRSENLKKPIIHKFLFFAIKKKTFCGFLSETKIYIQHFSAFFVCRLTSERCGATQCHYCDEHMKQNRFVHLLLRLTGKCKQVCKMQSWRRRSRSKNNNRWINILSDNGIRSDDGWVEKSEKFLLSCARAGN